MEFIPTGFGDSLRLMRLRAELTQLQVAAALGTHVSAISRIESDQRQPRAKFLGRLFALYKATDAEVAAAIRRAA